MTAPVKPEEWDGNAPDEAGGNAGVPPALSSLDRGWRRPGLELEVALVVALGVADGAKALRRDGIWRGDGRVVDVRRALRRTELVRLDWLLLLLGGRGVITGGRRLSERVRRWRSREARRGGRGEVAVLLLLHRVRSDVPVRRELVRTAAAVARPMAPRAAVASLWRAGGLGQDRKSVV